MLVQNVVARPLGKSAADPPPPHTHHVHKAMGEHLFLSVLRAACCQSMPHCTETLGGRTALVMTAS